MRCKDISGGCVGSSHAMQTTLSMKGLMIVMTLAASPAQKTAADVDAQKLRIQSLGPYVVRIEQAGPKGFEERPTFTIVDRTPWGERPEVVEADGKIVVRLDGYRMVAPCAGSFTNVTIENDKGKIIHKVGARDLHNAYLPSPSKLPDVWVLADAPRIVPPAWGALPPQEDRQDAHSGWDLSNPAPDLYVFFPRASGYEAFRSAFLRLTGPVPMLPLYAFGLWYSRYYPYSEASALCTMDRFRAAGIPLDVFVVDTDWRVGASHGYGINTDLFPDMRRFFERSHAKNVRVMLNDHPEPVGPHALSPEELEYRREGLESLLDLGADVWWFDRNWHTHLQSPAEGLNKEVWGMRLYHDITQANRPGKRPLIMSNVDGINHGRMDAPSHPAAHRYPVWWTGDTVAKWDYLRWGVENGVNAGVVMLLPYVNEDLGGHHEQPDAELYVRFMQFGAFSPIARIHCTTQVHRYPWAYGADVERIVGDYFRLRQRLLPTLYTAAFLAHRDGQPILRRCDIEWPRHKEAADPTQYLFGDDLLVAPIIEKGDDRRVANRMVWIPEGEWTDVWTGETHGGPATVEVSCPLDRMPIFARGGGIVLTIPDSLSTAESDWSRITADVFVPKADGVSRRLLYEDDGESVEYLAGKYGLTDLVMERNGLDLKFSISPSATHTGRRAKEREWVVRFHLPAGVKVGEVTLNGSTLSPERARVIAPGVQQGRATVFAGPGSGPASNEGVIVEIEAGRASTEARADFGIRFAPR